MVVSRLEEALETWPGLAERLFTEAERAYASGRPDPFQHLAVRFAAKEAAFKALGSGWPSLSWLEVEVSSRGGRPELELRGRARDLAAGAAAAVSLAHDGGLAIAQVTLLGGGLT